MLETYIDELLDGRQGWVSVAPSGELHRGMQMRGAALLSGSFNPLHDGHRGMHAVGERLLGREVLYELPLVNADKAPIGVREAMQRIRQFRGHATVLLTAAPLFDHKALLFPESKFILGVDTVSRLISPRFYGQDRAAMLESLAKMAALGCRFLVAGRLHEDSGEFQHLVDIALPAEFHHLFQAIPESSFRQDISSTQVRAQLANDQSEPNHQSKPC